MDFQQAYEAWLQRHREEGSPERRRKLRSGLGPAERVFVETAWWPLIGDFAHLHPEYEVADYSGAPRFLDFAYIRGSVRLAIEIDGYATHARDLDRRQFSYHLRRQNLLTVEGWDILRFSFDDVRDQPRRCQQTIQQYMGTRFATDLNDPANPGTPPRLTAVEREIVRLARSLPRPLAPRDVCDHLRVSRPTAYRHLKSLDARGILTPASGTKRIRSYRLTPRMRNAFL